MSSYRIRLLGARGRLATAVVLFAFAAFASAAAQQGQKVDKKSQERLDKAKRQQYLALSQLADAAMAGQAPQADFGLKWANDFSLKAQENKTYVPFTIELDPAKLPPGQALLYVRVVEKGAPPPGAAAAETEEKKEKKKESQPAAPVAYPFEDLHTFTAKPAAGQPVTMSRAFAVPGGEYDVYVVVAAGRGTGKDQAVGPADVLKQTLTVPDYWAQDLMTSPVILAEKIDELSAPLSQEQQIERPYVLGTMEITPAADPSFTKKEELSLIFLVYNVAVNESGKPDLEVEYRFNQKSGETEKFFNRTQPQQFNASTLPAQFDVRAGHQVIAGQSIPLESFPEGDYRLEIKLTDKISGKSLSRDVRFSVTS